MSQRSVRKTVLVRTFAFGAMLVPIVFGAAAQGDDEPMPVVRVNPVYPPEALRAGREGFVELEFTIAVNGATKDVVVIESSSPEFEEPAIAALRGWRYLPTNSECVGFERPPAEGSTTRAAVRCTENPNLPAVERPGVRTAMRFELDDDGNPRRPLPVP